MLCAGDPVSFKMKLIFYLFSLQATFSSFFVDGAKIIPLFKNGPGREKRSNYLFNIMENIHMPDWYAKQPERQVNGTELPSSLMTPDYRLAEQPFMGHPNRYKYNYIEFERPIRISPHYKQTYKWSRYKKNWLHSDNDEKPMNLGCYCTTVYRRLVLLAGCALITKRHALTTASSTDLVLDKILPKKDVYYQLGLWYDIDMDRWNSSVYGAPARIHHHPKYQRPHTVNISHPIPCHYDLSVWTLLHNTHPNSCICLRGSSHRFEYHSSTPRWPDISIIVGFQFMKAYKKLPTPWHKYAVRTKKHIVPCPKTEWGWFHCLLGNWAKFGLESGAAWHRSLENRYWLYDGLIGLASFSMHLRSEEITHYFTIVNVNHVLDFLYDSYVGMLPVRFLDGRFWNTKWGVPVKKEWVPYDVSTGDELYTNELPFYKK